LLYYALFGVTLGAQGVLWKPLKQALELRTGVFGTALMVLPLVAVSVLLQGGPLCAWAGKKYLAVAGLALLAAAALALTYAEELWGFVGALALAGAGGGLLETAMNAVTLDYEQAARREVMNLTHAGFSGGAVLGALGTGELLALGWDYGWVLGLLALLAGLGAAVTLPASYPPGDALPGGPGATLRLLFSRRNLVALALVCLLGGVGESVANNWSVLYLHELGADTFTGGVAFALFNGAMLAGRLVNAPVVARLGPRVSLVVSGLGLCLSALLLVLPGQVPLAVAALLVLGLAVAGVVPTALNAAAGLAPGNSGAVAGGMIAAVYVGFVLCPPVVGWLAELGSLQAALLLSVGFSGLAIIGSTRGVRKT
jgi:MFS family permease